MKLGCGQRDPDKPIPRFPAEATYEEVIEHIPDDTQYLIIESNRLIKKRKPDLSIFIDDPSGRIKKEIESIRDLWDLVSWTSITSEKARELVDHTQLPLGKKGGLLDHLHIKVAHCSLGLFSSRT